MSSKSQSKLKNPQFLAKLSTSVLYLIFALQGEDGTIWVWEKMNKGLPYRLETMEKVYKLYDFARSWGVRKLR